MKIKNRKGFFVTGTDTGAGKTLACLGLCLHFKASYWKPIQTGRPGDADFIRRFLPESRIHSCAFQFKQPLSPNQASEEEGIVINLKKIIVPQSPFLIVEGIGGVHVPLNKKENVMDLMKTVDLPLIVVVKSRIGAINHSLLTLEALKNRHFNMAGLIISGPLNFKNKRDIEQRSGVSVLLEIPPLSSITANRLKALFSSMKTSAKYLPAKSKKRIIIPSPH